MKYIRIFFGENVYSNAQWIFYFYVKDEMNHDISSQITQIHQQKDEKEYSDTPPPPCPLSADGREWFGKKLCLWEQTTALSLKGDDKNLGKSFA